MRKLGNTMTSSNSNKWDNLKKEWSVWYKMKTKETGVGWDDAKNTTEATYE